MKKLSLLCAALMALSFTTTREVTTFGAPKVHEALPSPWQNEKAFLLDYYRKTEKQLAKSIAGLSAEQLQFKPSAEEWSISQCLEHIIKTEKMLFEMAKETLAKPANPARKEEITVTDQQLLDGITDRSHKAEAPAELIGKGVYKDPHTAIADFKAQRAVILAYLEGVSTDDLRNHIADSPFGPVDAYHSMLFIAGHTARHTLQIEEVKTKDSFP